MLSANSRPADSSFPQHSLCLAFVFDQGFAAQHDILSMMLECQSSFVNSHSIMGKEFKENAASRPDLQLRFVDVATWSVLLLGCKGGRWSWNEEDKSEGLKVGYLAD